jgi:hypothetical protein
MRLPLIISAVLLAVAACGGGMDANAPTVTNFSYGQNSQPTPDLVPYDSVTAAARTIVIKRAAFGNLCGSTLRAGIAPAGAEITLNIIQTPITACAVPAALITYRVDIQLLAGQYHLRVVETNAVNTQGKVVVDQGVVVPAVD